MSNAHISSLYMGKVKDIFIYSVLIIITVIILLLLVVVIFNNI